MKKLVAIILTLCLCAGLCAAVAEGTYVKKYSTEEITQNTFHNGFVTALGGVEINTLVLNDDGTYVYTKEICNVDESGAKLVSTEEAPVMTITYTFTGAYTQDGDTVVLAFPNHVDFSEDWGNLAAMGYFKNSAGAADFADGEISGDIVQCKEEESHVAFDLFENPFLVDSLTTSDAAFDAEECTVTVTLTGDTFEYVIHNSDDD
ncbi:MAG: hypothetical protein IKP40_12870 [Clostridia bacterium]|nr:hypothetical protein [Clostridia bacterium]